MKYFKGDIVNVGYCEAEILGPSNQVGYDYKVRLLKPNKDLNKVADITAKLLHQCKQKERIFYFVIYCVDNKEYFHAIFEDNLIHPLPSKGSTYKGHPIVYIEPTNDNELSERQLERLLSLQFEQMRKEQDIPEEAFIGKNYGVHETIIQWTIHRIKQYGRMI